MRSIVLIVMIARASVAHAESDAERRLKHARAIEAQLDVKLSNTEDKLTCRAAIRLAGELAQIDPDRAVRARLRYEYLVCIGERPARSALPSPTLATLLSVGGTLAAAGLFTVAAATTEEPSPWIVAGAITAAVGPSFGHWYGRKAFTLGLGARLLAIPVVAAGVVMEVPCISGESGDCAGIPVTPVGGALFLTGVGYDIATAGSRVRRANERTLQIVPTVGSDRAGLVIGGRF